MAKIKQVQEDGTEIEVEVFTQEELNQKLNEKDAEWETKLSEKDAALTRFETERKDLEEKLDKATRDGIKEDHPNFKILKDALSKKDSEIQSIKNELDNDRKNRVKEEIENKIKIISRGDVELEKKMKLHLENTLIGMKDTTPEERQKKIEAAYKLSSDNSGDGQGMFDGGINGGGGNFNDFKPSVDTFTTREKALGKNLGITEEDYKKYAGRVSKK
jgi:DNA repair exonuclease SbcCD ATPase subunit